MFAALLLATAIAATSPSATVPGFIDEAGLHTVCDPGHGEDLTAAPLCYGYVIGVVDQLMVQQSRRAALHLRRTICLPKDASAEAVHGAVLGYLGRDPERSKTAAAPLIRHALEVSFPCRFSVKPNPLTGQSSPTT